MFLGFRALTPIVHYYATFRVVKVPVGGTDLAVDQVASSKCTAYLFMNFSQCMPDHSLIVCLNIIHYMYDTFTFSMNTTTVFKSEVKADDIC